jgi:ABC-type glycerol-3-phosphate transport system substrate-binding protein
MTDSLFAEGRLGMTEVGTYGQDAWYKEQQELGKLDPTKVKLDTVVAPSDVKNGIKPQHYLGADGACVFKRKEADRTGGAIAFLTFIQKSPEYARIYRAGGWPIRKAMEEADDKLPYRVAYIQKMSEFGSEQLMMPYWVAVRPITNPMWEAIIAGTKPIPELLKEAQAKIAEYIEKDQKRLIG